MYNLHSHFSQSADKLNVKTLMLTIIITLSSCTIWAQILPEPMVKHPVSDSKKNTSVQDTKPADPVIALPELPGENSEWDETGYASWYGGKFQGRLTANGEIFDTHKITAAHKTLPFNTIVIVTNMENGKSVEVRINDRGPFVAERIIDLSMAAAKEIDMVARGVAKVGINIIKMGDGKTFHNNVAEAEKYDIQLASYKEKTNAEKLYLRLVSEGLKPDYQNSGAYIRVVILNVKKSDLDRVRKKLDELGVKGYLVKAVY